MIIRREIDFISDIELIRVNAHFLKDSRNLWIKEGISNSPCDNVRDYFSL